MDTQQQTAEQNRTPAYVSFKSFATFIADQQEHGLPGRIDRSVLTKFSGGVGNQLISALKFLGLINDDQMPSPALSALVDAYGSDEWTVRLAELLNRAYSPIMACDLANATPAQFHEAFKNSYHAAADVMRKCESFFLNAAQAAQIPINARIVKHRAPRSVGPRRQIKGITKPAGTNDKRKARKDPEVADNGDKQRNNQTPYQVLIGILDPISMDQHEQDAVFTLIAYLRRKELGELA